jgi:itaconate CoA-transferase
MAKTRLNADMRAHDMLVQAESGVCAVRGSPDTPSKIGVSATDIATGMNAHAAVFEALLERERTNRGQAIEVAMFDGMADWMAVPLLHLEYPSARPDGSVWRMRPSLPIGLTRAATVGPPLSQFSSRANGVGSPPRSCGGRPFADERFTTNAWRVANRLALDA